MKIISMLIMLMIMACSVISCKQNGASVSPSGGGNLVVPATVEDIFPDSAVGSQISFWLIPDSDLIDGDRYIVLSSDITDIAGNHLNRMLFRSYYKSRI